MEITIIGLTMIVWLFLVFLYQIRIIIFLRFLWLKVGLIEKNLEDFIFSFEYLVIALYYFFSLLEDLI